MESTYLIDDFVSVKAGDPFRLFPFGRIVKNGKVREITRELAAKFNLPHFKPPIKLGSHNETTPAGGFIVGLEVRDDGLYAVPEWNDKGATSIAGGDYRYHSPEVIWDGGFENPDTGALINAPLIVGDALLHTPHLGEATALYSVEPKEETKDGEPMSEHTVTVPIGFWEKLTARLFDPQEPVEPTLPPDQTDDFEAEVVTLTAKVQQLEADKDEADKAIKLSAKIDVFAADFKKTALAEMSDLFGVLAKLEDGDAAIVTKELKALAEQAKQNGLEDDVGNNGSHKTVTERYNAAIEVKTDDGMNLADAVMAVANEDYELVKAAREEGAK